MEFMIVVNKDLLAGAGPIFPEATFASMARLTKETMY